MDVPFGVFAVMFYPCSDEDEETGREIVMQAGQFPKTDPLLQTGTYSVDVQC